jgi:hypothetical protein
MVFAIRTSNFELEGEGLGALEAWGLWRLGGFGRSGALDARGLWTYGGVGVVAGRHVAAD